MERNPEQEDRAFQTDASERRRGELLALLGFLGLCFLVWAAGGSLTAAGIPGWYHSLRRPPGAPPDWLFAPVWTTLYVMIGLSAWLVWRAPARPLRHTHAALRAWGWQLLLNALWTPLFFGLHRPDLALLALAGLIIAILLTIRRFHALDRVAAWLLVPYLCWTCYAAFVNAGFWWLNGMSDRIG